MTVARGAAVILLGSFVCMGWAPGAATTPWPLLALWMAGFAAYAFAAPQAATLSRREIWAVGIAARLVFLPLAPVLSEDVHRYVWDGWVARNGVNPFVFPPGAPELSPLRTDWWAMINHPDVSTIYPPGAQLAFLALAWIGPSWLLFKTGWLIADLATARLVEALADRRERAAGAGRADGRDGRGSGSRGLLLYLWSPLLIVEVAWSAHLEPLGLVLMVGAVWLAAGSRPAGAGFRAPAAGSHRLGAGLALGLGASVKFAPLAAVPALWRRHGWRPAALALLVPALLYLPYFAAGERLFSGLGTYADIWRFNAGVHRVLALLPGPAALPKWIGAAAILAVIGVSARDRWRLEKTLFWTIGTALALSPTIHPWYLLWALPFAALRQSRGWILWTGTVVLAYWGRDAYLATGAWPEPAWLALLIHAPPLALLALDRARNEGAQVLPERGQVAERE